MIDWKIIFKITGSLLFIEAGMLLLCLAMSLYFHEDDALAFASSIVIILIFAFMSKYWGRSSDNNLSRRDAYLVVTSSWVIFSFFGALPFMISGYVPSFTNAYFETMSGFTTTGATVIDDVEALPHGLLFWRSLTQWIGGLGIVFFTIAVLPGMTEGSVKVFAAEATGPIRTKLHPRLSTSAKSIWTVYLVMTIGCLASYVACGMSLFDGVNYSMTTLATGGFATHNDSTEFFRSPATDYITTLFCFLSGINFTLLYAAVVKLKIKNLFKSTEFRFYFYVVTGFTAFIMAELIWRNHYSIEHAFRSAVFQVVSFITTTGLFNDNAAVWPHVTWVILAICMFIGACSGSTSGGMKCIRATMLLKIIRNEFRQILHPNAVLPVKVDGTNVPMQTRVTLLSFLTIDLLLVLITAFIMIASGIDNTNAITISLSSIGNVGPTLGTEIGPTMSWNTLPAFAKWMCTLMMLIGRLEIFSVLVIFTPQFWNKN